MIGIRNQSPCPDFSKLVFVSDIDEAVGHVVGEDWTAVPEGREDPSGLLRIFWLFFCLSRRYSGRKDSPFGRFWARIALWPVSRKSVFSIKRHISSDMVLENRAFYGMVNMEKR